MPNKPDTSGKKQPLQVTEQLLVKLLDFEKEKNELEKIRQKTISKELDISSQTSAEATRIAEKEIDSSVDFMQRSMKYKGSLANKIFFVVILVIILFSASIYIFGKDNSNMLKTILDFGEKIVGYIVTFFFGYFANIARQAKSTNIPPTNE